MSYVNVNFFKEINTEEKAYWLGFICADGCVNKKTNIVCINLKRTDGKHIEKLGRVFNKKIYEGETFNKSKGIMSQYAMLSLCNREVKESLINCGVYPDKTKLDNIDVWQHIPSNLLHHFIRGYFDGDGCLTKTVLKNSKVNFCFSIAGSPRFLETLKQVLIRELGVYNTKTEQIDGCDVIRWSGKEQIQLITNWLYKNATVFLERKRLRAEEYATIGNRGLSKFRGVSWHKTNEKWLASISHNKKRINLGYYKEAVEAAQAYDAAVIKYQKPLYKINFKQEF